MADLDSDLVTHGQMGHAIPTSLRAIISGGAASIRTALGLGTAAVAAATAFISSAAGSVAATQLAGGFAKHALVAGGAAGDIAVSAIKVGDELNEVIQFIGAGTAVTDVADLTSQFSITADGTINNTGGTASSGDKLLVRWTKKTA